MSRIEKDVCVLIPTFCGSQTLTRALKSLLAQSIHPGRVYIRDDTPPTSPSERERISSIVNKFKDDLPIELRVNPLNLGYPRNLATLVADSEGEYIFLLAQDDVLSPIAIETCLQALHVYPDAGGVSRPYYWFDSSLERAVRQVPPINKLSPTFVTQASRWEEIQLVLFAAGQLTGLMYRRSRIREPFIDSIFPAHVAPFAGLLRDWGVVYVPETTVAVSIRESQTRFLNSIYEESPILSWNSMYESVFGSAKTSRVTRNGVQRHMGRNFVGLIQIRTQGRFRWFMRECKIMIMCRPLNLIDPRFLVTVLGLLVLPPKISRSLTDAFKSLVVGSFLRNVRLSDSRPKWWAVDSGL